MSSVEMYVKPGEVVWAKIVGYPWWPALVKWVMTKVVENDNPQQPNKSKVQFFGDNSQYGRVIL